MSAAAFPRYVEFQTTSRCNARCTVCPMHWTADALPQGRMTDELLDRLLGELAEHADELLSVEPYLNNEPFMDRRFLDVLRRIRAFTGASVEVSTNATLLRPETADAVLEEGLVNDFRMSVFGADRETYESVMKLDWDRMTRNITHYARRWVELGRPNQSRVVYVHNPTLQRPDEFERLRARWEPLGLGFINWAQLDRVGNVPFRQRDPMSVPGRVTNCKMGYMRDRVAISYDGSVFLCCQDWSRVERIGSVRDGGIAGVWNGAARARHYRWIYGEDLAPPDHLCRNCELATIG
jgi:hypothetical protein